MFEKESEEYSTSSKVDYVNNIAITLVQQGFKDGSEFGYNKANEWHYVKDEGTPTKEGHYLVCLRNKDRDIFDCWIYYDKDVGWYSMKVRMKDIYAWKEIVLPELKESER